MPSNRAPNLVFLSPLLLSMVAFRGVSGGISGGIFGQNPCTCTQCPAGQYAFKPSGTPGPAGL